MAVSNVGVDYRATPLSEMLTPEISYNQSVKTSTLIKDRVNNIIYPRTGQQNYSITPSNQPVIEFQISNTAFTDHTTPCLLMDVQLVFDNSNPTDTGAGNIGSKIGCINPASPASQTRVVVAESICPWFYQVQEMVNSSLVETTTDVDLSNMFKAMWQQPFDTYKSKSGFANPNFRFQDQGELPPSNGAVQNPLAFVLGGGLQTGIGAVGVGSPEQGIGGPVVTLTPGQQQGQLWLGTGTGVSTSGQPDGSSSSGTPGTAGATYTGAVVQVVVPLSWMALFSGSSYLPPFATSNIMLKLYTNQIQRIFTVYNTNASQVVTINGQANTTTAFAVGPQILSVNLNNVRLSYDAVIVSPAVEDAMLSMLNAGGKIYYPVIHHRVQNDICNMSGPQGGPKQFLLNCATSNLISLFQFFLKDTQLTSLNDPLTYMPNVGFGSLSESASNRYYVQIGSKTFPSVSQVVGAGSMWLELLKALGDGPLLAGRQEYFTIGDLDTNAVQTSAGAGQTGLPPFDRSGCFALGINFERIIGAVSQSANAGVSTRGVSGIIQSYLAPASATNTIVTVPAGIFPADTQVNFSSLRNEFRLISVMLYLEYLIIERGGVLSTNV